MPASILPHFDFLRLYKADGYWCFDRPEMGVEREPFVMGMTELIDAVIAEKPTPIENPVLFFGGEFNPSTRMRLNWREARTEEDGEWNLYHCPEMDMEGWLCPCLLKFFPEAPARLHFEIYDESNPIAQKLMAWISDAGSSAGRASIDRPLAADA